MKNMETKLKQLGNLDSDRLIAHSNLFFLCSLSLFFVVKSFLCSSLLDHWFFVVRLLVLLQVCSSSVLQVCSSALVLLQFWCSSSTKIESQRLGFSF